MRRDSRPAHPSSASRPVVSVSHRLATLPCVSSLYVKAIAADRFALAPDRHRPCARPDSRANRDAPTLYPASMLDAPPPYRYHMSVRIPAAHM